MMKTCSKCGETKDASRFVADKNRSDGLYPQCKDCMRAYREANREALRVKAAQHRADNKDAIKQRQTEWYAKNRDAYNRRRREQKAQARKPRQLALFKRDDLKADYNYRYHRANAEKIASQKATYNERTKEQRRTKDKAYYEANKAKRRAYIKVWIDRNREKVHEYEHKRRAIARNTYEHFTAAEWAALKAHYDYTCLCCKRREPDIKLTADHVIPLSCGGGNAIDNIQPLCLSCNSRKKTRTIDYRP